MALIKPQFRPGVVRDTTDYANSGGYFVTQLVRFRNGLPEMWKGWTKFSETALDGVARAIKAWTATDRNRYLFVGTNERLYIENAGTFANITPVRKTSSLTDKLSTTNTSAAVTVNDAGHGAAEGDWVFFPVDVTVGGITLSGSYQITSITDADNFVITHSSNATSTVSGGGGTFDIKYEFAVGRQSASRGGGWGVGGWGTGTWGTSRSSATFLNALRQIYVDNFGEDAIIVISDAESGVFYWDATNPTDRAVDISTLSGATDAVTVARCVIVDPATRITIYFGCNAAGSTSQDPLLIRWTDNENPVDLGVTDENSAEARRLQSGSEIVTARRVGNDILIWTDTTVLQMQFIGGDLIYAIQPLADNLSVIGQKAVAVAGQRVVWMGVDNFYVFDGRVEPLPCPIEEYLFGRISRLQANKVFAETNTEENEIVWWYQSTDGTEIDSYVAWNYENNIWTYGSLDRTVWMDRKPFDYPIAVDVDGYVYYHEFGTDDGSSSPPSAINAYFETSPVEIGEGEQFMYCDRMLPDVAYLDVTDVGVGAPEVSVILKGRRYVPNTIDQTDTTEVTAQSSSVVDVFTKQTWPRIRGRSLSVRVESNKRGFRWRWGAARYNVEPDGEN